MTCTELLQKLAAADIRLAAKGNTVQVDAPEELLTEALVNEIRRQKDEILAVLLSKLCFHCAGLHQCDCVSCSPGLALVGGDFAVKFGPCIACRGKADR